MNRCDPVLAGLPRDPDYCSSSDKALDSMTRWSRSLEPEIVESATSEQVVGEQIGSQSGEVPHKPPAHSSSDLPKERYHDQDQVKKDHNTAKKTLDSSLSKVKAKNSMVIPDSQKFFQSGLESLKSQLEAQSKAFLNHSVTMLEKESCLQQIKVQQLEELLSPTTSRQGEESRKCMEQGRQELYGALAQGLQGLQKTLRDGEEVQRAGTTRCLQLLAQEIQDRICVRSRPAWSTLDVVLK